MNGILKLVYWSTPICLGLMRSITWRKFKCMTCCTNNLWQEDQEHIENYFSRLVCAAVFHSLNVPKSRIVIWVRQAARAVTHHLQCLSTGMFLYLCVRLNSHLDMEMELNSLNLSTGTFFCVTNQLLKPGKPTSHLFSSFIAFKDLKKWSVNVLQPWLRGYLCFFLITVTHGSLLCAWLNMFVAERG